MINAEQLKFVKDDDGDWELYLETADSEWPEYLGLVGQDQSRTTFGVFFGLAGPLEVGTAEHCKEWLIQKIVNGELNPNV